MDYCQALVQVPNPLSQQAPNPDPKVRTSLKTQEPNSLDWADTIITWASHHPTTPPTTFKHEGAHEPAKKTSKNKDVG